MIELLFVRHGQTDWNLEGRLQGVVDIPLNSSGIEEAVSFADNFDIEVKSIISSPLKRAYETATIINENLNMNIVEDKRLTERDFGNFSGSIVCFKKILGKDHNDTNVEKIISVHERVLDFLKSAESLEDGRHLVVAHGGVISTILYLLSDEELTWDNTPLSNCSLSSVMFNEEWRINFYNEKILEQRVIMSCYL